MIKTKDKNSEELSNLEQWKGLFKIGGIASLIIVLLIPIQMFFFITWPPPETAVEFFALFQESWILGLISLDLLYIISNILMIPMLLSLYIALRERNQSYMLISIIICLIGLAAFLSSTVMFEMASLSNQYVVATTNDQKIQLLGAGAAMLATYKGTAFAIYYILNAIGLIILSVVMLQGSVFGKKTAYSGLISGILMIIPSTFGMIGLMLSVFSLIPWSIFSVLVTKELLKLAK